MTAALACRTTVESVVLAAADPPPVTSTRLAPAPAAFNDTLTVAVMGGQERPPASASARLQLEPEHVQPEPDMATSVRSDGSSSVTVTVPDVEPAPVWFETVT